jgi:RHS repeat-associated protein
MLVGWHRRLARLLALALLVSLLPSAALVAPAPAVEAAPAPTDNHSAPPLPALTPAPDPQLPSLAIAIDIAPDTIVVGDTAAITLTIDNAAPHAADDLVVSLPTPDGALPLPGPGLVSTAQGWQWNLGRLDGQASATLTATLRLLALPPGQALRLLPQASAAGLAAPIRARGGAVVVAARGPATAAFTPGTPATLRSRDGRVSVQLPATAADRRLTLRHRALADLLADGSGRGQTLPSRLARRGLGAFALDATDDSGADVHQFSAPLTITVSYTPEQLELLRIAEGALTLLWFDEAQRRWVALPTTIDRATQTASALVDHFTFYQLGNGASPSSTFVPSMQGWQLSGFTGAATYRYPFELPAGAGGLKPQLELTYNSAATDDDNAVMTLQQSSWVGKGWSLDTPSIALNRRAGPESHYYSLIMDGQSYDIVRGAPIAGVTTSINHIAGWTWYATDEQFLRVRATSDQSWAVWTKDGMRYDFTTTAKWGWNTGGAPEIETYKWLLTTVTDPHGNTINYTYNRIQVTHTGGTVDPDVWPTTITWGSNRYRVTFVSQPRRGDDSNNISGLEDMEWDFSSSQFGGQYGAPHATRQLDAIQVQVNLSQPYADTPANWQVIRQYNLAYNFSLYSDASICVTGPCTESSGTYGADPNYRKLTLLSVQRVGKDGTLFPSNTTPIKTSFTYETNRGAAKRANGGWNRLKTVNNGQGGTLTLGYENISQVYYDQGVGYYNLFFNRHRVNTRRVADGRGNTYLTTYGYGVAALNSLGSNNGVAGPNAWPNSATLFNANAEGALAELAVGDRREFRGHASMTERQYAKNTATAAELLQTIEHSFYQGDVGCTPADNDSADACFVQLRDREALKGREWRTRWLDSAGNALREVTHSFGLGWYLTTVYSPDGYVEYPTHGLWRAFSFESQTDERTCEASSATCDNPSTPSVTPPLKRTSYAYDPAYQGGAQYGNLTRILEYNGTTLVRDARRWHTPRDQESWSGSAPTPSYTVAYLVDRVYQEAVYDVNGYLLALSNSFYDGTSTASAAPTLGDLRRVARYYDIPPNTSDTTGITLHGGDTTYTYDSLGNRLSETTYAQAGTRLYNGSSISWSAPGAGSAARTTSLLYDDGGTALNEAFSGLPIRVTNPLSQIERADYDYRMGTLIRVTGPNTTGTPTDCRAASYSIPASEQSSCAQYDAFGRLVKLVRPGDSTTYPTTEAFYLDNAQPFLYRVYQREAPGQTWAVRVFGQFYDGLGRKIQTKSESSLNAQNIVVDTRYDALDRVTEQSQPRYVSEDATSFWNYTAPPSPPTPLYRPTTTTYDGLSRPRVITAPDSATTSTTYGLGSLGVIAATVDAGNHKTERESDALGRLRAVREYSGAGSFTLYGATSYAYDALDQLKTVTDALGNVTALTYDSAGRKTRTVDRDMGTWDYTYDANGNLLTQADGRTPRQTIWFGYDTLNRLTEKRLTNSGGTLLASYGYDAGTNGKGQRTSISVPSGASATFTYDARGRKTGATHTAPGLTGTRIFGWGYDSGDRLTTLTYPAVGGVTEQLTYSYDGAWRPTQVCSNRSGAPCYAELATYTALSQPEQWTLDNGLLQDWVYSSPMQRLAQLKVGGGAPASVFDRSYGYDNVGNVTAITDNKSASNNQTFGYDHRDRLTSWTLNGVTQTYAYNAIGNLTSKAGTTYTYPASGASSVRPHTPSQVGATAYSYDGNGNLLNDGGRAYTWNADNLPTQITHVSGNETYSYDADGERVKKVKGSTTTVYLEGLWEEVAGGAVKVYYPFSGQVVAVRDTGSGVVTYLHGDHLGSVSVATNQSQGIANQQEYDPWGKVRSGSMAATSRNYTGQVLDLTGLLYYHARMYDPNLGRFVSADSIVPGAASGAGSGAATLGRDAATQLKALTVDFHEVGFVSTLNAENQMRFWFQLNDEEREQAGSPWGPANPQALNRYAYVLNNPLRYTDPTGHATCYSGPGCGGVVYNNTNHSIWVVGTVEGPCTTDGHAGICSNVAVEVPPGKSSADVGVYDADAVVTGPLQQDANGNYKVLGAKLVNEEQATVSTNADGTDTITFVAQRSDLYWVVLWTAAQRAVRGLPFAFSPGNRVQPWNVRYVKAAGKPLKPV